jgi:hypothetical protein
MVIFACVPWDFLDQDAKRTKTIVAVIPAETEAFAAMASTRTAVNVRAASKEKTARIKFPDAKVVRAETVVRVLIKKIPTNALVQLDIQAITVGRSTAIVIQTLVNMEENV